MSLTSAQIATLHTELHSDPQSLGYAAMLATPDYVGLANLLNQTGSTAAYNVYVNNITISQIVGAIASTDFANLTALQAAKIQLLFSGSPLVDATNANTRASFAAIFTGMSTATTNALTALAQRYGSRAEVLFGTGTVLQVSDVVAAK